MLGRYLLLAASLLAIGLSLPAQAQALPPGGTFLDDDGSVHEGDIEAIFAEGITRGCSTSPSLYCPDDPVTRAQMASFLNRALALPPGPDAFGDDDGNPHEGDINAIAAAGITLGCQAAPPLYCPNDPVSRDQMASFLARAFDLPPGPEAFGDDDGNPHEGDINAIAAAGITRGCRTNPPLYCPSDRVTRAQMASFMARGLGLTPLVPPPRPGLTLQVAAQGLSSPTFATAPEGDPRLFVTELAGRVLIVQNGSLRTTPFLDIRDLVLSGGERGLLGMAFHPSYATNGRFYASYTNRVGDSEIAEFRVSSDPNVAIRASHRVLLTVDQPFSNHNGGMIEFGPDGYLYIALGDGGSGDCPNPCPSRDPSSLLGSILRIDVDSGTPYGIPPDNPFVSGGGAPEVWHKGLRNPWRFSFDPAEGHLYIADVGQGAWEEVNVVAASKGGLDFGWDVLEGAHCHEPSTGCSSAGTVLPALEYARSGGDCSVIGGFVYRGAALPHLHGHYFYADLCGRWIRSFDYANGAVTDQRDWSEDLTLSGSPWSFGRDGAGELYVVTGSGIVYRIVPAS